jgi:hypothetical protein
VSLAAPQLVYRRCSGYKYVVADAFVCAVPEFAALTVGHRWFALEGGKLTVRPGYAWDGCSGPTIDTPATMIPGLVHDVLYQCIRAGLLSPTHRKTADAVLRRLMLEQALSSQPSALSSLWSKTRAAYYYRAVRLFGGRCVRALDTEPQDALYTVP